MNIFTNSILEVADNSGAFWVKCLKIPEKKRSGVIGDFILVALRIYITNKKIKKGVKYIALILTVRSWSSRDDGSYVRFWSNRVILFNRTFKQLGGRCFGGVGKEVKYRIREKNATMKHYQRIVTYCPLII